MANTKRMHGESLLRVGPSGWTHSDWNQSVYPSNRPHGFHETAYLAEYFSVLEIDSSFFRPLRPEVSRVWVQKLAGAKNFEFTAKLHHSFTHQQNLDPVAIRRFELGLEPLIDNGLLGCLLAQFPATFRLNGPNLSHVARLARTFSRYPLVAEFRHASWNNSRALAALADLGIGFSNVDQPQLSSLMPPTDHVTSPIGYVRFCGRNYDSDSQSHGDYLYSSQQLAKWRPRLDKLANSCEKLYVVTSNHLAGQSVANALQVASMVREQRVDVPPAALDRYPELNCIALNQPSERSIFFEGSKALRPNYGAWMSQQTHAAAA